MLQIVPAFCNPVGDAPVLLPYQWGTHRAHLRLLIFSWTGTSTRILVRVTVENYN